MNATRILLGLAAAAAFGLAAGQLAPLTDMTGSATMQSVFLCFAGTAIGGFIARRGFVLPALGLWLVEWIVVAWFLLRIAAPTGQASLPAILQLNLPAIVLSAIAVVLGALNGQALARYMQPSAPVI